MAKKNPNKTPKSQIKNALRQLWLRSRERNAALKLANRTCSHCGIRGTAAKGKEVKLEVHHTHGIDWDGIVDIIITRVLQTPQDYTVLCEDCHRKLHSSESSSAGKS